MAKTKGGRRSLRTGSWVLATVAAAALALAAAGCGDSDESDQAALEAAKKQGAQQARQRARLRDLEQELKEVKEAKKAEVPTSSSSSSGAAVPTDGVVDPYISTYRPYTPSQAGYDSYVAEVPTGGGWSGPDESFPTGGGLLRSSFRGPDGTLVLIDYTPGEVPKLGGTYNSIDTDLQTNFGRATTYVFSASERLPECNGRPCVDILINDGSGGGWAVLGGGPNLAVAEAIADHVAQSITYRGE